MREDRDKIAVCLGCSLPHLLARALLVFQGSIPRRGGELGGGGKESRYIETKKSSLQAQNRNKTILLP